jgi:hypothetical protein
VNKKYAIEVKTKLKEMIDRTKQMKKNEVMSSLIAFLKEIYISYEHFEIYFEFLEVIYLNKRLTEIKN